VSEETTVQLGEVTELYLPRRTFTKANTQWNVSSGGRIHFDWENQRAFLWFVDIPPERRVQDMVRRVDIWVPSRTRKDGVTLIQGIGMVVALLLGLALTYHYQLIEWENERRVGLRQ
jgi:hypothetical protein